MKVLYKSPLSRLGPAPVIGNKGKGVSRKCEKIVFHLQSGIPLVIGEGGQNVMIKTVKNLRTVQFSEKIGQDVFSSKCIFVTCISVSVPSLRISWALRVHKNAKHNLVSSKWYYANWCLKQNEPLKRLLQSNKRSLIVKITISAFYWPSSDAP